MTTGQTGLPIVGRRIRMTVRGAPVQQGSMDGRCVGRHAVVYASNEKALKPWRNHIRDVGVGAMAGAAPLDGPLRIRMTFTLERGKTVTRRWPTVPPDLDKLVRAVFDALSPSKKKPGASVWTDDARVVRVEATKLYVGELGALDSPGVSIEVTELG